MPLDKPFTSVGAYLLLRISPSPTWPLVAAPQHFRPPPVVNAQVCISPAVIACTPLVKPYTSNGAVLAPPLFSLSPSAPESCLPQHFMPPPVVNVQLCPPAPSATVCVPLDKV